MAYTGGPWPFGYHGLGDLFVFLFFGPVAVAGTYYVQALRWGGPDTLLAGVAIGALTTAILVVNNLRDAETDARGWLVLNSLRGGLLALGGLMAMARAVREVWRFNDPRTLNHALEGTARGAGVYGLLFAVGCLV